MRKTARVVVLAGRENAARLELDDNLVKRNSPLGAEPEVFFGTPAEFHLGSLAKNMKICRLIGVAAARVLKVRIKMYLAPAYGGEPLTPTLSCQYIKLYASEAVAICDRF